MKTVVMVACGKIKTDCEAKACEIFKSPFFKRNWNEACRDYPESDKYILSSKYGLVNAQDIISPYEQDYPDKEEDLNKWAQQVVGDLINQGFDPLNDELVIYASKRIAGAIVSCFPVLKKYTIISHGYRKTPYTITGQKI